MQKNNKYQLVLASQSPRRQELLKWAYLPFEVLVSSLPEESSKVVPAELAMDLALQKALHVKRQRQNAVIIGADTIVVLDQNILGKPKDRAMARQMLQKLQGRSHEVITGVSFVYGEQSMTFYESTVVNFDRISDDLLECYLDTNESMDKAGAYGIQGAALGFIGKIEGSYSNVVGLPVNLVVKKLPHFLDLDVNSNWRLLFE
jgi:septum formation protein